MATYIKPNAIKDASIEGIKIKDGTISSSKIDGTVASKNYVDTKVTNAVQITYSELKSLRDAGKLVPGTQYRITDYTCTTTQANTKSAGHVFDIIVTADSKNKLNENARAIQHTDDTYFANSKLESWELKYCLDNDTTRFAWADATNGKGVIYWMKDEYDNECLYDFKNIQFYREWDADKSLWSTMSSDNTGVPCYTFSSSGNSATTLFTDMSLLASNKVYSNVIKKYVSSNKQTLNNNCFFGNGCYSNTFGNNGQYNTFGNNCSSNTFGNNCNNNTFGNNCSRNTFGNDCNANSFGDGCYSNIFGNECNANSFGNDCYSNTFGNGCYRNTFGNYFQENTFGNTCYSNTFGNGHYYNTFGNNCNNNTFGNRCFSNTFGNDCYSNTFGNECNYNTFGNYCSRNTFGNYCSRNTFGNNCNNNTFGNYIQESQFGDSVQYFSITTQQMATNPTSSYLKNYIRQLIVENGVSYVNAYVTGTTSPSLYCQNVRICLGIQGVNYNNNRKTFDITSCISSTVSNVYQPANSQTTSV